MFKNKQFLGIVLVASMLFFSFGIPKKIEKKVIKEVNKVFEIGSFEMVPVQIDENFKSQLSAKFTQDNFFKITKDDDVLGYVFVSQAPSKTAKFDYLIIFDESLKIKHSKVLIYREEYGGEIGSKRWLKQFLGKTGGDRVNYQTNIDGIAGATISVRSMTSAIDDLLKSVEILQVNNVL